MWLLTWIIAPVSNCLILAPLTSFDHGLLYNMQIWLFDFPIITPPHSAFHGVSDPYSLAPACLSYAHSCRIHTLSSFHVLALRFLFLSKPFLSHASGTAIAIVRNLTIASPQCSFVRISSHQRLALPSFSSLLLPLRSLSFFLPTPTPFSCVLSN